MSGLAHSRRFHRAYCLRSPSYSRLLVGFLAAQVWNDADRAHGAVNREASALRGVVILASAFPGDTETRLRELVRRHIEDAVTEEWPALSRRAATLTIIPPRLAEGLKLALALDPHGDGQSVAQRELVESLEIALDARRQRIILAIFATGIAVAIVLIASHSRPFSGQLAVSPAVLLQVMPETGDTF